MPTYDYECDACQHTWEMFQRITENAKRKCPQCKKLKARRLFGTGSAVMFKGSGFYETDYRSESYKKGAKADKDSQSKSSGDSKSGDSKSGRESKSGNSKSGNSTSGGDSKPANKSSE